MNHPHERLADYVLDLLELEEACQIEAHLASCDACRAEVKALREALFALTDTLPPLPPRRRTWARILQRLGTPRAPRGWIAAAVAGILLALGAAAWSAVLTRELQALHAERALLSTYLSASHVAVRTLTTPQGTVLGSVLFLPDGRALFFLTAPPPPGKAYQAWGHRNGTRVSLGLTQTQVIEVRWRGFQFVGVSLEPAGGSPEPTEPLGRVPVI